MPQLRAAITAQTTIEAYLQARNNRRSTGRPSRRARCAAWPGSLRSRRGAPGTQGAEPSLSTSPCLLPPSRPTRYQTFGMHGRKEPHGRSPPISTCFRAPVSAARSAPMRLRAGLQPIPLSMATMLIATSLGFKSERIAAAF